MKARILVAALCSTAVFGPLSFADNPQISVVQSDVKRCGEAVYAHDVETSLKCTYPKVIETMGGETKAKETLTNTYAYLKQRSMKLISMTFPADPTFFSDKDNDYCFVPTLSVVEGSGKKAESLNFQMGVKPKGSSQWHYLEGSRLTRENVKELFPNFPADVKFPPFYRKLL